MCECIQSFVVVHQCSRVYDHEMVVFVKGDCFIGSNFVCFQWRHVCQGFYLWIDLYVDWFSRVEVEDLFKLFVGLFESVVGVWDQYFVCVGGIGDDEVFI